MVSSGVHIDKRMILRFVHTFSVGGATLARTATMQASVGQWAANVGETMDIDQARTFLAVVTRGSFVAASEELHVTQTAVSARIQRLETQLDTCLFVRDKSGARLTPAGARFIKYATAFVSVWEDARQQVALPAGRAEIARVGGEPSLWNPLLVDWLLWMNGHAPDVAVRIEVEIAERLIERVQEGTLDLAIVYGPPQRPNLVVELLADEKLVMVTTDPKGTWAPETYVHVDWGAAFTASSRAAFPAVSSPAVSASLGPLALRYLESAGGSGYFRSSAVKGLIKQRALTRVASAPEFSHSVYAVYPPREHEGVLGCVRQGLKECVGGWAQPTKRPRTR